MTTQARNFVFALAAALIAAAVFVTTCRSPEPLLVQGPAAAQAAPAPAPDPVPTVPPEATRTIKVDGREVIVGARDKVTFEHKDTVTDTGGSARSDRHASTTGVGLETSAEKVAQSFKAETARTELDDVGAASGGGFSYSGKMSGGMAVNIFHAIGAACLLGALAFVVVPMILKTAPRLGTAAALAAGGLAFIAIGSSIESMPWAWAIAGVLILAGLGFWLFMAIRTGTAEKHTAAVLGVKKNAIEAFVAATASLDPETAAKVKAAMNATMASWTASERAQVETEVAATKAQLGA